MKKKLLVTLYDFMNAFVSGLQTDIAIMDFSKAFYTVPYKKLLSNIEEYESRGQLNNWFNIFPKQRKMNVIVEGEQSEEIKVDSGVLQGIVLGHLLFLCHMYDLTDTVIRTVVCR